MLVHGPLCLSSHLLSNTRRQVLVYAFGFPAGLGSGQTLGLDQLCIVPGVAHGRCLTNVNSTLL